MNIGKSIKVAAAMKGWSNTQTAVKLGVSPSYMSQLKAKERCSHEMLPRLAALFEMKESELIALGEE